MKSAKNEIQDLKIKTIVMIQIKIHNYLMSTQNKVNFIFLSIIINILTQSLFIQIAAAKQCAQNDSEQEMRNVKLKEKCGAGITWDLTHFSTDNSVCASRKQGLELIEKVINDFCQDNADEIKTKIKTLQVQSRADLKTQYELNGTTLSALVPQEETAILTKWASEEEKLKTFIKQKTGLALLTANEKKRLEEQKKNAEKAANASAKKDSAIKSREEIKEKREAILAKLKAAVQKFQTQNTAIWARPGSSAEEMAQKKKEADAAQTEFNTTQQEFQKELDGLNKK